MRWDDFIQLAIPVPFVEKGREFTGWDCWGLVVCAYREVLGTELPSFNDQYFSTRNYKTISKLFAQGMELVVPCDCSVGSIALIYRRSSRIHCGIVAPGRLVLHTEEFIGTVQQPFNEFRIEGFYEPR